jgi:hypothetical protein
MPVAAVAEEHDVDSLVALTVLVDRRAATASERADHRADRVGVEGLGKGEGETHSVDATGHEQQGEHHDHRDDRPPTRHPDPAREDVVARTAAAADV